jgi:hypothetical protein
MAPDEASVASDFAKLTRELDAVLAEILGVASCAATTTGAAWLAIVEATTGQPPAGLPAAGAGANPAEVRTVLIAMKAAYERRLVPVERASKQCEISDELEDAIWDFRRRRLDQFVNDEVAGYIKRVTPRPSVASAFAKAASAANLTKASAVAPPLAAPSVELHRCKTCAAPRLSDGLYGNCLYCGQPFFTGYVMEE